MRVWIHHHNTSPNNAGKHHFSMTHNTLHTNLPEKRLSYLHRHTVALIIIIILIIVMCSFLCHFSVPDRNLKSNDPLSKNLRVNRLNWRSQYSSSQQSLIIIFVSPKPPLDFIFLLLFFFFFFSVFLRITLHHKCLLTIFTNHIVHF